MPTTTQDIRTQAMKTSESLTLLLRKINSEGNLSKSEQSEFLSLLRSALKETPEFVQESREIIAKRINIDSDKNFIDVSNIIISLNGAVDFVKRSKEKIKSVLVLDEALIGMYLDAKNNPNPIDDLIFKMLDYKYHAKTPVEDRADEEIKLLSGLHDKFFREAQVINERLKEAGSREQLIRGENTSRNEVEETKGRQAEMIKDHKAEMEQTQEFSDEVKKRDPKL